MNERRSQIEIIYDMLRAIQLKGGKIKPTHLLYKSNLSHKRMKDYLGSLLSKGLVEQGALSGKKMFLLTDMGYKFLQDYKKVREFTDAFGL